MKVAPTLVDGLKMSSLSPISAGKLVFYVLLWICLISAIVANEATAEDDQEPLPDPNDENYAGMIYIGRMHEDGKRIGFDVDNGRIYRACCTCSMELFVTCTTLTQSLL